MNVTHPNGVCAIVGIGPGLGAALARCFAAAGYRVVGLTRDPGKLAGLPCAALLAADASNPVGLATALADGARAAGGPIRILIYNAYRSTMTQSGPASLDTSDMVEDFRVNVAGALAAAQAVLPAMLAGGGGTILFTGGGLALDPTGWLGAASLAIGKSGLRSLALSLHAELAPRGVHVGTVTIAGQIQPGTGFDPDRVAQAFLALHADPPGGFRNEIIYRGDTSL
jgi:NAD(P)-dependent dehydrogenase (short-subunit alcohol dehydrogenase family)